MHNRSTTSDVPHLLKTAGLRVTPQRDAILSFLIQHEGHASVDEIFQAIHTTYPNLSVSTVYNTMKHFSEVGLVREITFGDAASRFDWNTTPHHHLVCVKCGKLHDFYLPVTLDFSSIASQAHFEVQEYHLELKGICKDCQPSHSHSSTIQ